ncbi:hypothetical protein BJ085DRAFT_39917 [Dimargaris cristalligena]|uniref:F-box domain-containing protein n=1 Tax=Dimargaris cristalligena TaxID=215637 RepID=A0A4V1J3W8_9FUNG|nr:hypothetical protein BJ085DRAFT_39917 [Dimargaris cristalligena]|eukprot:RKP33509.1 hypothetical protein BJ085DRAFT_39917 [Dimargaris cristalligena]
MKVSIGVYAIATGLVLAWNTQATLLEGTDDAHESTSPASDLSGVLKLPNELILDIFSQLDWTMLRNLTPDHIWVGKFAICTLQEQDQ